MSPTEFGKLISRFYEVASHVMVHSNALIDKIIGDQVAGMYVPGFAGPDHARAAVEAAHELLRATGHGSSKDPWMPLGVGVHSGVAYVGSMGSEQSTTDITVLGDVANTAARLSSSAGVGEILLSEAACLAAGAESAARERRSLVLKGKQDPFSVYVLNPFGDGSSGR
jgi:adenylate cyclase